MDSGQWTVDSGQWAVDSVCLAATRRGAGTMGDVAHKAATVGRAGEINNVEPRPLVALAEIPDECPVLIGQIPLELLDFVVDPAGGKLIGNPDHGGEQMIDMF